MNDSGEMKQLREITTSRKILIAGTLLSSVLFIWLLLRQDWGLTWKTLNQVPVLLWPLTLSLIIFGMLFNAWRWLVLLRAQSVPVPTREIVKTVFAGAFASNFLPSTIGGDAFRILSLLRFTPNKTLCVASVVMDRALNVIAYLSYLPYALSILYPRFDILNQSLAVFPFVFPVFEKIQSSFLRFKEQLVKAFSVWARQPKTIVYALIISWFSIIAVLAAVWLIARGLGMPVSIFQVMGVSVITYLITMLPISINGYGLREVTETSLYISVGATLEQSVALVLITRFFMLVETLPGALWLSQILSWQQPARVCENKKEG